MKLVNARKQYLVLLFLLIVWQLVPAQILTLEQCIETAKVNNKKLELDRNNIQIGKDKQAQIKANLLPKVKIETDYKYFIDLPYQLMPLSVFGGPEGQFKEAQFGVPHNVNANVQFAMPLYNPQVRSNIKVAKIGIELAALKYQKSAEQLYFDIANLYFNAQILLSQQGFINANLENSYKLLKNIKLLHEQAMVKGTDVDKISLQILQLEGKKDRVISNYEQILNGMKMMMGVKMDEKFDVEPTIEYREMESYTNQSTIDIQMIATKNRLLLGELNTIEKSRLPTVFLYGSYGVTGYGYDQSPNEFLNFYPIGFVGLKATYSLFDGNMNKKKKNLKQKEITNNNLQLALLTDQNDMQVRNARLKIGVSTQALETTQSQIAFAQSIYNQIIIQQKQGIASITDVLLADSALREAQQNYLSAIIEFLKADLELKKLSGNIN